MYSDVLWRILVYSDVFLRIMTYSGVFLRILVYPGANPKRVPEDLRPQKLILEPSRACFDDTFCPPSKHREMRDLAYCGVFWVYYGVF